MKKLLVLLLLLAMAGIASADIMPDGGFESGSWSGHNAYVYNSTNWGYGTHNHVTSPPDAYSGAKFMSFGLPASGAAYSWTSYLYVGWETFDSGWAAAWQQGLVVSGGDVLQASSYIKQLSGPAGGAGFMKIEWYNDTGKLGQDIESFVATASWAQVTGSLFTAPAGTTNVTMVVGNESWTGGLMGTAIGFDNVSLTIVPEPMSIALLGLGGLILRRRKA